jgi:hypothetical protein
VALRRWHPVSRLQDHCPLVFPLRNAPGPPPPAAGRPVVLAVRPRTRCRRAGHYTARGRCILPIQRRLPPRSTTTRTRQPRQPAATRRLRTMNHFLPVRARTGLHTRALRAVFTQATEAISTTPRTGSSPATHHVRLRHRMRTLRLAPPEARCCRRRARCGSESRRYFAVPRLRVGTAGLILTTGPFSRVIYSRFNRSRFRYCALAAVVCCCCPLLYPHPFDIPCFLGPPALGQLYHTGIDCCATGPTSS